MKDNDAKKDCMKDCKKEETKENMKDCRMEDTKENMKDCKKEDTKENMKDCRMEDTKNSMEDSKKKSMMNTGKGVACNTASGMATASNASAGSTACKATGISTGKATGKAVIEAEGLTKDYGKGRGVFDLNFRIAEGEMMGYVGTNGSGKTTTIRNILGYIKPTAGNVKVMGYTSWEHASDIAKHIGYVPGEIAVPELSTGVDFIKSQAEFLELKDMSYAETLIERLQLDPKANLKRMSKGMKQKTALVAALMADSPIIILDEPTTGLDPLMRDTFLDIIEEEHKKGKTIFMSSHMFEEMDRTCDRVAFINDGHILDIVDMDTIRHPKAKQFKIEFKNYTDYTRFIQNEGYTITRTQEQYFQVTAKAETAETGRLLSVLEKYDVKFISELPFTLEKYFKTMLMEQKQVQQMQAQQMHAQHIQV